MTVVKINALEIPEAAGEEIVKRFAARMESLDGVPGFEGFELLRPTGESERRLARRFFDGTSGDPDWAGFAQVLLCSNAFLYRD